MAGTSQSPLERIDEDRALRLILEGTVSETGEAFFKALVRNLSAALRVPYAWVSEWSPGRRTLRALAFWWDDRFVEDFEYPVDGTPCQPVIDRACLAHFPERLFEIFPRDPDLLKMDAVSYLGTPLLDTDGTLLGHLSVMDRRPMPAEPRLLTLFEIFAARASAEYRRLRVEREMRAQSERMRLLFVSAMDAIITLNSDLCMTGANPAAQRVFGCDEENLVGETLRDFLPSSTVASIEALAREVLSRPELDRKLWIPGPLTAMRWDRSTFPFEGSLSCFQHGPDICYTLMLRDVNERLGWEKKIRELTDETEYLREVVGETPSEMGIVGRSQATRAVCEAIRQVGQTDAGVLITGETGTGKELVARAIHECSLRKDGRMVRVNCAAIPESLIESEFFGHERGAFTGATTRREGRFAQAHGGTIFLDEVAELPLELQAKLLRVLQEGEFEPLGSDRTQKVDVRVIAATNRDIAAEVKSGRFREDLYYRLNVFPIHLPPLRVRGEDVALLAETFARRMARRMGRRFERLQEEDAALLRAYDWPGNVRELQNVIERALILSNGSGLALLRALPSDAARNLPTPSFQTSSVSRVLTAAELAELERANLSRAVESAGGKISGANGVAALLGLPPSTVASRMKAMGITVRRGAS
jgi:PAS domain S-box-containing protein